MVRKYEHEGFEIFIDFENKQRKDIGDLKTIIGYDFCFQIIYNRFGLNQKTLNLLLLISYGFSEYNSKKLVEEKVKSIKDELQDFIKNIDK